MTSEIWEFIWERTSRRSPECVGQREGETDMTRLEDAPNNPDVVARTEKAIADRAALYIPPIPADHSFDGTDPALPAQTGWRTDPAARKERPIATGVIDYFPDALAEVALVSKAGNDQHGTVGWDRSVSADEANTLIRHFVERGTIDTDGQRHSAKVAWRALAMLQKEIEASRSTGD